MPWLRFYGRGSFLAQLDQVKNDTAVQKTEEEFDNKDKNKLTAAVINMTNLPCFFFFFQDLDKMSDSDSESSGPDEFYVYENPPRPVSVKNQVSLYMYISFQLMMLMFYS